MPGYGTFPAPFVSRLGYVQAARSVQQYIEQALALGYRHIDTAFAYRNQDLVGAAIGAQHIPRQEVFVTSKLHPNNNTYNDALSKIREAIGLIWGSQHGGAHYYLDAFLLHYPGLRKPIAAWKGLLKARAEGLVKHVGVSNFEIWHLEKLRETSGEYPELNQIEFHPLIYREQKDLLEFCRTKGIAAEAYSPLAEGEVLRDPDVGLLAEAHKTSPARVALKWCMQHGLRPIVGTRHPDHIRNNAQAYTFALSGDEMLRLDSISSRRMTRVSLKWHWNPKTAPLGNSNWYASVRNFLRRFAPGLRRG